MTELIADKLCHESLLEAGFKQHRMAEEGDKILYQKRVTDEIGVRYFINVWFYQTLNSFECKVCFGNGLESWGEPIWITIGCAAKTTEGLVQFVDYLWTQLSPRYYEQYA